jgi:pimeloyl-ACP methyl ester carboxylesterase
VTTSTPSQRTTVHATRTFAGLAGHLQGDDDGRPPVVLLHGFTFDRTMWEPALEELRRLDPGRRVLALDLPGHGGSTGAWAYDGESVGNAVFLAVRAAGLTEPIVVGHSYSGILATFYGGRMQARGVVNVDQTLQTRPFIGLLRAHASEFEGDGLPGIWSVIAASMHAELLPAPARDLVLSTCHPRPDLLRGYWGEALDGGSDLGARLEAELGRLRESGTPYLIVAGDEPGDEYRRWLRDVLPQARIEVWPGSGHFPHLAHPERFAEVLNATETW